MNLDWNSTVEMVDFRVASTVPTDIRLPSTCEEHTSTTAILVWA
ncbi:Os09g0404300 [Oryza sativa Japonica Group]|uniref:Os09g0404300 protein n=1 Tax=Oryza sativa subsp. japonica TaxID=39947 RepID=C7J707_ORYSJ|nr:Os09g0404300 [Oryza sativa Japonica Group]|eukprot:NP_001175824.1 Os09g0404300 [Oryza sativa Japonica Group]